MHLGGLLSTQEANSYASVFLCFVLSNLTRASITPWFVHTPHVYHFLISKLELFEFLIAKGMENI